MGKKTGSKTPKVTAAAPAATSDSRKRKQLGRRDSEEATERALREKFPSLSKVALETKEVDGVKLRDRVREDRRKLEESKGSKRLTWRQLLA